MPHPIDVFVGQRLRRRRRELGMTQESLAATLDKTPQQVQKYERGANRVSASTLWQAAKSLKVSVGYFFRGCEGEGVETEEREAGFWSSIEGKRLAAAFLNISDERVRSQLLGIVTALAK